MSSIDVGTLIAIVVPNCVAGGAIYAGWTQQARTLEAERERADLEHTRTVLDEAAVLLHKAAYALDDARSHLTQYAYGFFENEERERPYHELWRIGQELDALVERLSIRLGRDHDITNAFRKADEAILAVWRSLGLLRSEPEAEVEWAQEERRRLLRETQSGTEAQRSIFDVERRRFIDAAQRAAGAHLSG
jgi:hypothetical protein